MKTDQDLKENEASAVNGDMVTDVSTPKKKRQKKRKWPKRLIVIVIILAVVLAGVYYLRQRLGVKPTASQDTYLTAPVTRMDITQRLSVTGTLMPADSYTVTTLNEGKILSSDFNESAKVEKGDVLYVLDSSDTTTTLDRARLTLSNAQSAYQKKLDKRDDLNVRTPAAGYVTEVNVEVGDEVAAGQTIASVTDSAVMSIAMPFPADDAAAFTVGQSAVVTLDGSFEKLPGTVAKVSKTVRVLTGNLMVRDVTIEVANPGALAQSQAATATVGDAACCAGGTFAYRSQVKVTAAVAGTVARIDVGEGGWADKKQTVVTLTSQALEEEIESAQNAVKDAELSLQNAVDKVGEYTITSPISGTIVEKAFKTGDKAQTGSKLCTIYDLSYLTITMDVDELDIGNIYEGQKAEITSDAVMGKVFSGVVTKVSVVGKTTNGVTTYPVTVRIDQTEGLRPGMNVNMGIIVAQRTNVLAVPAAAVKRGYRILVKSGSPAEGNPPASASIGGNASVGGNAGIAGVGGSVSADGAKGGVPEGFEYVNITTGISDGNYVEVTGGLKEGDTVAYTVLSSGGMNYYGGMAMSGKSETIVVGG